MYIVCCAWTSLLCCTLFCILIAFACCYCRLWITRLVEKRQKGIFTNFRLQRYHCAYYRFAGNRIEQKVILGMCIQSFQDVWINIVNCSLPVNRIQVTIARDLDPSVFLCGMRLFNEVESFKGALRQITTVLFA